MSRTFRVVALFAVMAVASLLALIPGRAVAGQDVLDLWEATAAPPVPEAKAVAVNPATTALLILDIEAATCNVERRPRCLDTVPRIAALAERFRAKGAPVLYSLTRVGSPETVLPPVKAHPGEPFVQSTVDKFLGTKLDDLLKERHVDTVVITGTAAHGAVLHTATGAAQRGYGVVLPVDGLSAESVFIEKAAVWLLLEGPATKGKVSLTRCGQVGWKE